MKDLIEKLKDKNYVKAFGLMSEEDQECCKNIMDSIFSSFRTYAIKKNYQPEPEPVDLEVVENGKFLGIALNDIDVLPYVFTKLHELPSLSNFKCFWYENKHRLSYEDVAATISEGKKVFARFNKRLGE